MKPIISAVGLFATGIFLFNPRLSHLSFQKLHLIIIDYNIKGLTQANSYINKKTYF
jgi:hypothetical protein